LHSIEWKWSVLYCLRFIETLTKKKRKLKLMKSKLKDLIFAGGLLFATTLSSLGASGNSGPVWSGGDFLGGNQGVFLTNGQTYVFNTNGLLTGFINPQGAYVFALTNVYLTNTSGFQNQASGGFGTNANAFYGQAWYDVPSFSDANGNNASASIAITLQGSPTVYSTNIVSFIFTPMMVLSNSPNAGVLAFPSTTSNLTFNVTGATNTPGSTSNSVLVTQFFQIPSGAMQGVAGWRLSSISNGASAGAGWQYLNVLRLNGYRP
jgi:hypothetical protein